MVRILNFICVALAGLSCLALYHVSESTRVARNELTSVNHQIAQEQQLTNVLEAEWARVAEPARIQALARQKLGFDDRSSAELASLELLPRRGEAGAPLTSSRMRNANDVVPAKPRNPNIRAVSARTGT